ncbi:MAG: YdcF family protein [Clostridiales bacterium]|nr:YdcF family protein [Clostridiales bacterium]MCF8021089.1 YdcF family protein [Clostridiales bacterium]
MLYVIKFIYHFFLPPGIFVILLFILAAWTYKNRRRAAVLIMITATCLYIISTSFVGNTLIRSLEKCYGLPDKITADVIVMLGGGATLDTPNIEGKGHLSGSASNRLLTAVRLYKKTGLPVIIAGGQVYKNSGNEAQIAKRYMVDLGVNPDKIIIENKSRNTTENAKNTARVMNEYNYEKVSLVTSAFHMRRAVINFQKVGVTVQPYPTDYKSSIKLALYPNNFVPCHDGIYKSGLAAKEYLGILYLSLF